MIDALVVGGGLAGAALAARLANAQREVVLVEREAHAADKVCGEFLSYEAVQDLTSLGLDLRALGALPIDAVRLCPRGSRRKTSISLPFSALSLTRRTLDEALLERAAAMGVRVVRGVKVQALTRLAESLQTEKNGPLAAWSAQLADNTTHVARAAFIATGKHDLHGRIRPEGVQNDLVAFKMYVRLTNDQAGQLERHVELALFQDGYTGLQPVEQNRANLCLLMRRSRFRALGARWENVLAAICAESPHLAMRLEGAEMCLEKPLALASIPYGYVRRTAPDGLWHLGDQAAVIPSFSGDGMAIALHSAKLAASMHYAGKSAEAFQRTLARDVAAQVWLATRLSQGLVAGRTQCAIGLAARFFPGLMAFVARRTRVSRVALARADNASRDIDKKYARDSGYASPSASTSTPVCVIR